MRIEVRAVAISGGLRTHHPGPLEAFVRRIIERKNRSAAITALAQKLVAIAYLMLKNNDPYHYARLERMREKFTKLKTLPPSRILPRPRGTPRPGLSAVFQAAGLPPAKEPPEMPDGKRRMLAERELTTFVADLYQPRETQPRSTIPAKKSSGRPKGRPG